MSTILCESRPILEFLMLENIRSIPPEFLSELELAVDRLIKGIRDPEAMNRACERMDRMREEMRQRVGEVEVAVDLIREAREES
jgi:hypothetical protein